ncbi:MAG: RNA-binding domain-containing protein [Candidatus Heimdallarchaeota archaeon]
MFKAKVITKQFPTENPKKVAVALKTIISGEVQTHTIGSETYLYIESSDYKSLQVYYDLIRKQKILDIARKTLRNNIVGNASMFFVNKQVAYVGKINFCAEEGESPLGPIRVEIEYDNIDHLIDWLTPYTKNGVEVKLVTKFP